MFKRYWWVFFAMVPLGSLVGLLVAAVITYMMPKKYESEAIIQIMPRSEPAAMERSRSQAPPQHATEVEILKSRTVLDQVAANLQLPNRWHVDKETAIHILKGIVETRRINGTDLIAIRARHTNRIDARDIAGELVTVYKAGLAERSGVALSTLKLLETKGWGSFQRLVRVAVTLGIDGELRDLFAKPASMESIAAVKRSERQRAPRREKKKAQGGT